MKDIDIIGFPYREGIDLLSIIPDYSIQVINTYGLNKRYNISLSEPRILSTSITNNIVTVVVGYF